MLLNFLFSFTARFVTMLVLVAGSALGAEEAKPLKPHEQIPGIFHGTWKSALTSTDGGKTYLTADGAPLFRVNRETVTVLKKTEFGEGEKKVKDMMPSPGLDNEIVVTFADGARWRFQRNGHNCTVMMYDLSKPGWPEVRRITLRLEK